MVRPIGAASVATGVPIFTGRTYLVLLFLAFCAGVARAGEPEPRISDDGLSAGYATISWMGVSAQSGEKSFEIEIVRNGTPFLRHTVADTATTLTGLDNGDYRFRVRRTGGAWSAPLAFTVRHHGLGRAFGFLAAGAVVFVALLMLLVTGRKAGTAP